MDPCNRMVAVRGEVGGLVVSKKVKGLAKEHVCIPADIDNSVVMAGRKGELGLGRVGQGWGKLKQLQ